MTKLFQLTFHHFPINIGAFFVFFPLIWIVDPTINLISRTNHSCERSEYAFMILRKYTIISHFCHLSISKGYLIFKWIFSFRILYFCIFFTYLYKYFHFNYTSISIILFKRLPLFGIFFSKNVLILLCLSRNKTKGQFSKNITLTLTKTLRKK